MSNDGADVDAEVTSGPKVLQFFSQGDEVHELCEGVIAQAALDAASGKLSAIVISYMIDGNVVTMMHGRVIEKMGLALAMVSSVTTSFQSLASLEAIDAEAEDVEATDAAGQEQEEENANGEVEVQRLDVAQEDEGAE